MFCLFLSGVVLVKIGLFFNVVVIGLCGLGKSDLFDILYGIRVFFEGYVMINGFDLWDVCFDFFCEKVVLVWGIEVFVGKVDENFYFYCFDIFFSDVWDVFEWVGLFDDVFCLEKGLDIYFFSGGWLFLGN